MQEKSPRDSDFDLTDTIPLIQVGLMALDALKRCNDSETRQMLEETVRRALIGSQQEVGHAT